MSTPAGIPVGGPASGHRPLDGITVVEVATYLSGPFGGMMLCQLGADVIKIEPPGGEAYRRFGRPTGPANPLFVNANGGKRSVMLDLKDPAARDKLLNLLDRADVLLSNWRGGVAERLGLADATLAARNPRLIRTYITGYGADGPSAGRPAFDSVIQAASGVAWAFSDDHNPRLATGYLVDKLSGTFVCQAILAALVDRERTGVAPRVDMSMLEIAAYFNFPELLINRTFVDAQPADARNRFAAANRPVRAKDGNLLVAPVSSKQMRATLAAVGLAEKADELMAIKDAMHLTVTMLEWVESKTGTKTVDEWLEIFDAHDVPAARSVTADEHFADPQVQHLGLYEILDRPGMGRTREIRYPAQSSTWERLGNRRPAPFLDADADLLP